MALLNRGSTTRQIATIRCRPTAGLGCISVPGHARQPNGGRLAIGKRLASARQSRNSGRVLFPSGSDRLFQKH
jgi:hypothetical protein